MHSESSAVTGKPVVLVVSPHAGNSTSGPTPATLLKMAGAVVGEQLLVRDLDHNFPQGARWRERGFGAVVAAGGDGTIGAVASQLPDSGLPLGILPMGTSNDIARSLGVPLDLAQASAAIVHGTVAEIDVGQAVPAVTEPGVLSQATVSAETAGAQQMHERIAARGAYFLHSVTLGLNVDFARLATDVARRERWGSLTYATSLIEGLAQFQAVPVTLRLSGVRATGGQSGPLDDLTVSCRVLQIAAVNTPVFGGAMNLRLPDVTPQDRLLDFVVIEALEPARMRATMEDLLAELRRIVENWLGRSTPPASGTEHAEPSNDVIGITLPGVRRYKARSAVIETPHDVDVTLDGEIRARTPLLVRVAPEPLQVLLPAGAPPEVSGAGARVESLAESENGQQ